MCTSVSRYCLFENYPTLRHKLAFQPLANLPTPVERSPGLEKALGVASIFIKRDDLSSRIFGGNKVRKLEFLLGAARVSGARTVITVGAAGSNHALATALHCRYLGLRTALMLYPQPNARVVQQNLLADLWAEADIHTYDNYSEHRSNVEKLIAVYRSRDGVEPFFIPTGGSSPLGCLGYVNAGLELAEQIAKGLLPSPARIYVALGSMGTVAGLWLGLRAARVQSTIVAVRVTPSVIASEEGLIRLIKQTATLLSDVEPTFPVPSFCEHLPYVDHRFFGGEYGRYTAESVEAMRTAAEHAGMHLDGTYTGKALAALINDVRNGAAQGPLLFWNTRNSRPLPDAAFRGDYHRLPRALWRYFEEDVQQLDRSLPT